MPLNLHLNSPEDFDQIANEILNNHLFALGGTRYQIFEIEFYLHSKDHPDPYVHCDPRQLTVNQWYFHRKGNSYKGGTFKGVDITFADGAYGGILIRTIGHVGGRDVIEGPCNVVDHILYEHSANSVAQLVSRWPDLNAIGGTGCGIVRGGQDPEPIYMCRRVGLNRDKNIDYWAAPYRYMIHPHLIKRDRTAIRAGMRDNHGMDDEDIRRVLSKKN